MKRRYLPLFACAGGLSGWVLAGWAPPESPAMVETATTNEPTRLTPLVRSSTIAMPALPSTGIDRRIALETLASRDPERALAATLDAIGTDTKSQRIEDLSTIFKIWANTDREAAIRGFLDSRSAFELREFEKGPIFRALASQAPDETLSALQKMSVPVHQAVWEYELTVAALARHDPLLAMQRAAEFKAIFDQEAVEDADRDYLKNDHGGISLSGWVPTFHKAVIDEWIRSDASAGLAWLRENPIEGSDSQSLMLSVVDHDPDLVASLLADQFAKGETKGHYQTLTKLGEQMGKRDSEAALEWLDRLDTDDGNVRRPYISGIVRGLAEKGAFDQAAAVFDRRVQEEEHAFGLDVPHALATEWTKEDPEAALEWAQALPKSLSDTAVAKVLGQWSRHDRAAASEYFHLIPDDIPDNRFLNGDPVVGASNVRTSEEASALIREPGMLGRASNLALQLAKRHPLEASAFISQEIEHLNNPEAAEHVMYRWVEEDPQAAGEWARTLPDTWRKPALKQLMTLWSRLDEDGSKAWVATLPEGQRQEAEEGIGVKVDNRMIFTFGP